MQVIVKETRNQTKTNRALSNNARFNENVSIHTIQINIQYLIHAVINVLFNVIYGQNTHITQDVIGSYTFSR